MFGFLRRERRSLSPDATVGASDPYLARFLDASPAASAEGVLSNSSVAVRCIALRSELLASVGLHLYRRTDNGGRERADDQPLYGVMHDLLNPNLDAYEGRELLIRSLDLAGNAYARVERNARGQVSALYPILPGQMAVERLPSGRLRYRVSEISGGVTVLLQEEVLHIRGPSRDGLVGQSPVALARGALGLHLAQQQAAQSLMANSLRPSGVLSFPQALTTQQRKDLGDMMRQRFQGARNAGELLVIDGAGEFKPMTISPDDAQLLESRKLSNEDVARIFNVPPTAVGILDKGTYSNVEQEGRALVQNCLGPLAARIEAALARCLLTDPGRRIYYFEHDLSSLLRGDVAARFEAYRIAREIGVFSPNDVRRRENEPPIAEGDTYNQPANWLPLGATPAASGGSNANA